MQEFVLDNASTAYRQTRQELLAAEVALKQQRERVASLRRQLPTDTVTQDYTFTEIAAPIGQSGERHSVRLSDLFIDPDKPLMVIHYMWNPVDAGPCPMCTMWADTYNGAAPHLAQNANVVCIVKQEIEIFRAFADARGWGNLRLLSSGGSTFNHDLGMENENGNQFPGLSVFTRNDAGEVRHFYSTTAMIGEDRSRGLDLYTPVWPLLDLLPDGRGDWFPSVDYG